MKRISTYSKIVISCIVFLYTMLQNVSAQKGYIYVHAKSLSEDINQSFTFSVSGGGTSVPNFTLEDQALNIEPTDIGAGHGTGGGELWAVAGTRGGANGPIYHRLPNSTTWNLVSDQTASSIDGADLGHCVFVNASGDAYAYNGLTFAKIFDHTIMGSNAVDIANNGSIAYGNGVTAVVDNNGIIWKYTGDYITITTWSNITPVDNSGNIFERLDINPTTNDIVLIDGGGFVTKINSMGAGLVYYCRGGVSSGFTMDVAVDGNGTIYESDHNNTSSFDMVFRYDGSTWIAEPEMSQHYFLTCGDAGQAWCTKGYPIAEYPWISNPSTIYSRTDDGTGTWLDDERVQTSQNDNSIIIPVAAGTYTLTEANISTWNLQNIVIYDSTSGSTTNVANNSATIVVTAGQVVHVVFTNGLVAPTALPIGCGINVVLQNFGSGVANTTGPPLSGLTDYHYFNNNSQYPNDGYYSLSQNSNLWTNSGLTDHSGITNGYFLVINASYAKDQIYKHRVTGLIPGAYYNLSFWAANLSNSSPQQPNILAGITDTSTGIILGSISTGYFPVDMSWHQYTFSFTATVTTGDIFLQNNAPGGNGNDLAIDDITIAQLCTTLPVTLINFTAQKENTTSILNWSTANQVSFSHFEIERSANGSTWLSLNNIAGKDDNSLTKNYTFTDELPINGLNYYRLKMVDMNGTIIYSEVETLNFINNEWNVNIYPNPVATGNVVQVQSNQPLQMIRVFDINGKIIMAENISSVETNGNSTYSLSTGILPAGMYLLQTKNINGKMNSLKLLKKN